MGMHPVDIEIQCAGTADEEIGRLADSLRFDSIAQHRIDEWIEITLSGLSQSVRVMAQNMIDVRAVAVDEQFHRIFCQPKLSGTFQAIGFECLKAFRSADFPARKRHFLRRYFLESDAIFLLELPGDQVHYAFAHFTVAG